MAKPVRDLRSFMKSLEPEVQGAFLEALARKTSNVDLEALREAIRARNAQAVVSLLELDQASLAPVLRALRSIFERGGDRSIAQFEKMAQSQGTRIGIGFDENHTRAAEHVARKAAQFVKIMGDESREAVRSTILEAFRRGDASPRVVALDLVGRVDRATGQRVGGVIGLTKKQTKWVDDAFDELTSSDSRLMRNYLTRKARSPRYDAEIKTAIESQKGLSPSRARVITTKYKNNLLRYRGQVIARTEVLSQVHAAQDEAINQVIDSTGVIREDVTRIWDSADDDDTRDTHRDMDDQRKQPGEAFVSPSGAQLMHPGDTELGAGPEEIIQCRCVVRIDIDFLAQLKRSQ